MSYILDALKKIEHEKNKKARPDGRLSISGDLFQERNRPAARTGIWKVVALIALVSLVTCAGTWFALQGNSRRNIAVIRSASVPSPPPVSSNPLIATPPVPVPVQSQSAPVSAPPATPSATVPATPKNSETFGDIDSPVREVRYSKKRIMEQSASSKQYAQTVPVPADIKLSGIAWQEERAARRAVVNGFLLKEGAIVSGARIIDIQADRVHFSSSAGQFEMRLDAVLPAEVKR